MNADALARLGRIASGALPGPIGLTITPVVTPQRPNVTPVTPVTPCRVSLGKAVRESVAEGPDLAEFEERAGLAADCVPVLYLDAWARLNCQRPALVADAGWRLALDDGGEFLDAWGMFSAELHWSAGDLFDVPREGRLGGLVWRLNGARVKRLNAVSAILTDGRELRGSER